MNRSKGINRLFLAMVLISLASPYFLGRLLAGANIYQNFAVSQLIFLAPVLVYLLLDRGRILGELQIQWLGFSEILMVLLLGILLLPVVSWINMLSMMFAQNYVASTLAETESAALGLNFLYVALIPAVSEEFMFRGVFFHGYRSAGIRKAALYSGLCFGLLHMNLNQFCYAFVLGVILAIVVEATGSILSSILIHMVINGSSVLSLAALSGLDLPEESAQTVQAVSRNELLMTLGFYTMWAVLFGMLAILAIRWLARHSGRGEHMRLVLLGQENSAPRGQETWTPDMEQWAEAPDTEQWAEAPNMERWAETPDTERRAEAPDMERKTEAPDTEQWTKASDTGNNWEAGYDRYGEAKDGREHGQSSRPSRRIVTPCLLAAVVICVGYMVSMEFFL